MVALVPGVKKLPQITVRELNGRVLLSPAAREVFVGTLTIEEEMHTAAPPYKTFLLQRCDDVDEVVR